MILNDADDFKNFYRESNELSFSGPVEVLNSEVDYFRRINPDKRSISDFVKKIKREQEESYGKYDFNDDGSALSVLYIKEKHHERIKKYVDTGADILKGSEMFWSKNDNYITLAVNVVKKNTEEITNFLMNFFTPDYEVHLGNSENSYSERKIISSDKKKKNISSILTDFKVPENISSDIEDIYNSGFSTSVFISLFASIATYFFSEKLRKNEEKTNFASENIIIEESDDDDSDSDDDIRFEE